MRYGVQIHEHGDEPAELLSERRLLLPGERPEDVRQIGSVGIEPHGTVELVGLAEPLELELEALAGVPRRPLRDAPVRELEAHPDLGVGLVLPAVGGRPATRLERPEDRALPRRVRAHEDGERLELELHVAQAAEVLDVDAPDHAASLPDSARNASQPFARPCSPTPARRAAGRASTSVTLTADRERHARRLARRRRSPRVAAEGRMAPVQRGVRDALVVVAGLRTLRGPAAEGAQVRAVDVATPGGKDRRDGLEDADVRVAGGELD